MPESAEVKIVTEYLKSTLENKIVVDFCFLKGQYQEELPIGFYDFERLLPLIVENVECKGKLIYFTLFNEDKYIYIIHDLRMTGSWQEFEDRYCRWNIELYNGKKIWFRNPRCLATLEFTMDKSIVEKRLSLLGPDILTPSFNFYTWKKLLHTHKEKNVTLFLMDQQIMCGIGNYIKAEVLYYAKISPYRKISSLSSEESDKLFEAIRIIPRISYNNNGINVNEYGDKGNYNNLLKIYGKLKARKDKTADGRITYWDPKIQE